MAKGLCSSCRVALTLENAPISVVKKGYGQCRKCHTIWSEGWRAKNPEKARISNRKWYRAHPEQARASARRYRKSHPDKVYEMNRKGELKRFYGLTLDDFERKIRNQNNKCAICGSEFTKTPHVDHDHVSGKTRDLLCSPCNVLLGNSKDNVLILEKAIQYLKKHGDLNGGR